jgi:hypothetical protein
VILTMVDRFSMYAHFIPLGHPYTAASVARAFFDGIVQLHGFPLSIVSDRDPVFTGSCDLFGLAGVKLRMSTTFHPQMDGQSEVVNKVIAMYLHCVTGDRPRSWVDWLSWAEYCYYTFHTALCATPFEVIYGRPPPPILPYTVGSAKTEAADTPPQPRRDAGRGALAASTGVAALQEVLRRQPSRRGARRRRLGLAAPPPDRAVARPTGSAQAGSPLRWPVPGVGARRQGRLPTTASSRRPDS